jgi:hypothetical protein
MRAGTLVVLLAAVLPGCTSGSALLPREDPAVARVTQQEIEPDEVGYSRPRVRARRAARTIPSKETTSSIDMDGRRTMPAVGSPEWHRAKAEDEEKERRLNQTIRNICRGC